MKNKKNISDELILKVLNNEASESENKIFQEWVSHSPQNKKIFLHIGKLWQESNDIKDYHKINQENAWNTIYTKIRQNPKQRLMPPMIRVAAAIALAYLLGALTIYLIQTKPKQSIALNKEIFVKVPLGSKTEVQLSDGTKVWLNSGSEVRYPAIFGQNQRDIYLMGEAYFDVEKNKEVPFFVHTDEVDIKVLGTRFNVKSYREEGLVETTLEEGLINIGKKGSDQVLLLNPKEKATLVKNDDLPGKREGQFVITKNIDTELYTSWKSEKLIFKREKFGALAVKLERWYNVRISVGNKDLADERVTGIFENESIEQVLEALKISVPFTYETNKNHITIH